MFVPDGIFCVLDTSDLSCTSHHSQLSDEETVQHFTQTGAWSLIDQSRLFGSQTDTERETQIVVPSDSIKNNSNKMTEVWCILILAMGAIMITIWEFFDFHQDFRQRISGILQKTPEFG